MTPGARIQAAIELLSAIHAGAAPADRAAAAFFRARRYIGGSDRRAVLDAVYAVLRHMAKLDWWIDRAYPERPEGGQEVPDIERARVIAKLVLIDHWTADKVAGSFDGGQYRPKPLNRSERSFAKEMEGADLRHGEQPKWVRFEFPAWIEPYLISQFGPNFEREMAAQLEEAATDLRTNSLKATREEAIAALRNEGIDSAPTPLSPLGLRISGRPPLANLKCFQDGLIEVQDEGSQLAALLVDARPGQRVVDFCAGAGGKTLAIAAAMKNKGKIVACDTLKGRVERAGERLKRAGAFNVERRGLESERDPWVKRHAGTFDRVLVDAPCSGAGTWRRNPDAKWRLSPDDLTRLTALQKSILDSAQRLVKPGGRLIYATCSLLAQENDQQVEAFLANHPDFAAVPVADVWQQVIATDCPAREATLSLTPLRHGTDGFFVAVMERRKAASNPDQAPDPAVDDSEA
ncbi:MAG: RsmB/NOP family class I SAM-dependent RNA methyltransferase [Rhodospirillaceae bacterium]|nr:RsmB/NOP family class I SAM-dependent RNA methyltransferase [Rhodospirillaceae bacterium]